MAVVQKAGRGAWELSMWFRTLLRRLGATMVWCGTLGAGLWVASGWWQFAVSSRRGLILLSNGSLTLDGNALAIDWTRPQELSLKVQLIPDQRPAWTLWRWFVVHPPGFYARIGMIPVPPVLLVIGGTLWRLGYTGMGRRCSACGYDMRGIQSWVCPECGEPVGKGARTIVGDQQAQQLKRELRARLTRTVAALTLEQRAARSGAACGRALNADLFPAGAMVMLYAPMLEKGELDLRLLAEGLAIRGCTICVPRVDWKRGTMVPVRVENLTTDLVDDSGGRGVRSARPEAPAAEIGRLGVVVVPGLGFDRRGNRLGRGAGFYDRFLAELAKEAPGAACLALAFDEQMVDAIPTEPHDARMAWIITPTDVIPGV